MNRNRFECLFVNSVNDVIIGIGGVNLLEVRSNDDSPNLRYIQDPDHFRTPRIKDDDISIVFGIGARIETMVGLLFLVRIWSSVSDKQQVILGIQGLEIKMVK